MTILYRVIYLTVHPAVFSDGYSEGQLRDIGGGFPPDSDPYIEDYDYLSDSDLEDGSSHSEDEEGLQDGSGSWQQGLDGARDPESPQAIVPNNPPSRPLLVETTEVQNNDRSSCFSSDFYLFN